MNFWVNVPPEVQEALANLSQQEKPTKKILEAVVTQARACEQGLQGLHAWLAGLSASVQRHAGWEPNLQRMAESLKTALDLCEGLRTQRDADSASMSQTLADIRREVQATEANASDSLARLRTWAPVCEEMRLKQIQLETKISHLEANLGLRLAELERPRPVQTPQRPSQCLCVSKFWKMSWES